MLLDEPKSMYNGVPHRIKAEVEEKEDKKRFYLLLAKRSSLNAISLTTYLECLVTKDKTKK
jgi:hypothetical protein